MQSNKEVMDSAKYVIIGAGLAGMATAYGLACRGESDVVVLEKESFPGLHSSGRNAAMIRQVVQNEHILSLSKKGAGFFHGQPQGWQNPVPFANSGSLLVARGESWNDLLEDADSARSAGVDLETWDAERVLKAVPCTKGGDFEGGVYCPVDGVTDTDGLIGGFSGAARAKGIRVETECEVLAIHVEKSKVAGVETNRGFIRTTAVVNASGSWASMIAGLAGALAIEFTPMRRHLYYTGALGWVDQDWPFVWDVSRDVYFRPESAGLLLSPCDETPVAPGIPTVEESTQDLLADKLAGSFPRLLDLPVARSWAGLRTFAPDRMFVIGWDPRVEDFFWVAGLGGHGVTTSPAVGALAAKELLSGKREISSPFSPARFL